MQCATPRMDRKCRAFCSAGISLQDSANPRHSTASVLRANRGAREGLRSASLVDPSRRLPLEFTSAAAADLEASFGAALEADRNAAVGAID